MKILLSLFLLSATIAYADPLPYKDGDFGCFDAAKADRYLSDFQVDVDSFGGRELCNGAKDTKKLLNDLYLIENAQFQATKDHSFIKGYVDRANYYSWMKAQTRGVNRGHDIPYATAYNSGGYFTMQDGWATISTLGRVGTIIHEARHTAGYRHFICTFGPYANSSVSGCDTSYAQGGSHAVEMEYYARVVLEAKNLHPAYQSMARLMALGRSNFVFNQTPMKKREALLGLTQDKIVLIDGDQVIERPLPAAAVGSRLKRTSFGASLVKGEKAIAVDLYLKDQINFSASDDYSYYKLFQSVRDGAPKQVNDTEELDQGVMRYFTVLGEQGKVFAYDFPNGVWANASAALPDARSFITRAPNGQAGLFVVKADGTIVPYDLVNRRYGSPLADRWTANTAAIAVYNNSTLVKLMNDGTVVDSSNDTALPSLTNYRFTDLVNVPLYDTFQVVR